MEPGPETDEGGLNAAGVQRVSWDHIEAVTVSGGGPALILGTDGEDEITIIARDATYDPLADGVQDFTASVNDGPEILYINIPAVFVDALAGDDDIVLREPAPNNAVWDVDLTIVGGPPAAATGDSGDVFELETPGTQSVTFAPTGADTATLNDTTNSSLITLTNSFTIPALNYTSSPGGVEQVVYQGLGGNDLLTFDTSASGVGANGITFTPGATPDAGSILARTLGGSGTPLLPFDFTDIGAGGSVTFTNGNGRVDALDLNGTSASDLFTVSSTGQLQILDSFGSLFRTVVINTPGISFRRPCTVWKAMTPSIWRAHCRSLPPSLTAAIRRPATSSTSLAPLAAVTINLADSTLPTNTTVTGYGGTVTLIGVEVLNANAAGNALTVNGTAGPNALSYTPTGTRGRNRRLSPA